MTSKDLIEAVARVREKKRKEKEGLDRSIDRSMKKIQ